MQTKDPIRYEVKPQAVNRGMRWVTLTLENIGEETLHNLSADLASRDTYCVRILGKGMFISSLAPGETSELPFQGTFEGSGDVYGTLEGQKDDQPFHWESPDLAISVDSQPAEIVRFSIATAPHQAQLREPLTFEATVRGLIKSVNLVIEFWVEVPDGELLSLDKEGLGTLDEGQEKKRTIEFIPEKEGLYVFHVYLYQGARRIGHQIEYLSVAL